MAHQVCKEITEWIEEQVQKPVEQWVNQLQKTCREQSCNWWCLCCNKWLCWFVWVVVKVVTWVLVTVGKWVAHTVCEWVADVLDLVVSVIKGLVDIIVGIVTFNWPRVWDGIVELVGGVVGFVFDIFRIVALGDTIGYIRDEINKAKLRDHVRSLLERKYEGEQLQRIKDALGVDYGAFGFRIGARAVRTFVRSDFKSTPAGPPDLILWNDNATLRLPLKEIAGYTYSEFWRRFRPEVVADQGGFSESDLDTYITSRGTAGKAFSIFAMDKGTLQTKLDTASEKGRQVGLMFKWRIDDVRVKKPEHVRQHGFDTNDSDAALVRFLVDPIGRHRESGDPAAAQADLCTPTACGIFFYTDNLNGLSAHVHTTTCLDNSQFGGSDASGVTLKDRLPDLVWKYVAVHELGHYFSLCHVDGLDRIMVSTMDHSWWSWGLIPEYVYLSGGPIFVLDEAKKVWDYIIAFFPAECLATRAE